jgi:hypothetical protein
MTHWTYPSRSSYSSYLSKSPHLPQNHWFLQLLLCKLQQWLFCYHIILPCILVLYIHLFANHSLEGDRSERARATSLGVAIFWGTRPPRHRATVACMEEEEKEAATEWFKISEGAGPHFHFELPHFRLTTAPQTFHLVYPRRSRVSVRLQCAEIMWHSLCSSFRIHYCHWWYKKQFASRLQGPDCHLQQVE